MPRPNTTFRWPLTFAREQDLPLAVRSGGHSLALYSVVDDALVIDLSGMKRVRIDPEQRIAYVQPGATSGDLAGPAGEHGLALSTGDTHSVGMGGLTTGGGIGFMARKYGLAIDNLLAARVVLADGSIVTASATERPDLFWAIRGGGGNFGIITEFTYRLAPVGQIYGGALILPATKEVLRGYLDYATSAPEDLTTIANLMFAPPAPFIPEDKVGSLVLIILPVWTGSIEDGEKAMAPLRALAEPVVDLVSPMPYPMIYRFTDFAAEPHGASIRSMFSDDLSDDAIDAILSAMKQRFDAIRPGPAPRSRRRAGQGRYVRDGLRPPRREGHDWPSSTSGSTRPRTAHRTLPGPRRSGRRFAAKVIGRLRQLPRRGGRGPHPRRVPAGHLRQAGEDQGLLRPGQRLPLQPEHQAERVTTTLLSIPPLTPSPGSAPTTGALPSISEHRCEISQTTIRIGARADVQSGTRATFVAVLSPHFLGKSHASARFFSVERLRCGSVTRRMCIGARIGTTVSMK